MFGYVRHISIEDRKIKHQDFDTKTKAIGLDNYSREDQKNAFDKIQGDKRKYDRVVSPGKSPKKEISIFIKLILTVLKSCR